MGVQRVRGVFQQAAKSRTTPGVETEIVTDGERSSDTNAAERTEELYGVAVVWATVGRALTAVREDGDDIHVPFANGVRSDDRDATVGTRDILMHDVAECAALDGNLLTFLRFVIHHQNFDKGTGRADDLLELDAAKHALVLRGVWPTGRFVIL